MKIYNSSTSIISQLCNPMTACFDSNITQEINKLFLELYNYNITIINDSNRLYFGNCASILFQNFMASMRFHNVHTSASIYVGYPIILDNLGYNYVLHDIHPQYINCIDINELPDIKITYLHTVMNSDISAYEIKLFKFIKKNGGYIILDSSICMFNKLEKIQKYIDINIYSLSMEKCLPLGTGGIIEFYNNELLAKFKNTNTNITIGHICGYIYFDYISLSLLKMMDVKIAYKKFKILRLISKYNKSLVHGPTMYLQCDDKCKYTTDYLPTFNKNLTMFKNYMNVYSYLYKVKLLDDNGEIKYEYL